MKTVVIGDIHGRSVWKLITHLENPGRVIFIGDYFDTHEDITPAQQLHNFKEIIEYKISRKAEVILLIGNHDHHYFPEVGYTGTSGYQSGAAPSIAQVLDENREHLQMVYKMDEFLFSHAGVGKTWLRGQGWDGGDIADFVNEVWRHKPKEFEFNGYLSMTGDDVTQTPIWIRPYSLMKDAQDFKKDIIQVVGHTSMKHIDIEGKATGGRYYFIDTLGTSGEYLIITDGEVSINKI